MIDLKIKKTRADAQIPTQATPGSAGLDMYCVDWNYNEPRTSEYIEYHTGISIEIPEGYVGLIFPRSSITLYDIMLKNSVGVIDSDYRGEILVRFHALRENGIEMYTKGDKIAQLVIVPVPTVNIIEVNELSDTQRGIGGFGSTDLKEIKTLIDEING